MYETELGLFMQAMGQVIYYYLKLNPHLRWEIRNELFKLRHMLAGARGAGALNISSGSLKDYPAGGSSMVMLNSMQIAGLIRCRFNSKYTELVVFTSAPRHFFLDNSTMCNNASRASILASKFLQSPEGVRPQSINVSINQSIEPDSGKNETSVKSN